MQICTNKKTPCKLDKQDLQMRKMLKNQSLSVRSIHSFGILRMEKVGSYIMLKQGIVI